MATESPLLHDGGQCLTSTAFDARRSSITGTTLNGPNGSAQFYCVSLSSGRQVTSASSTANGAQIYGVLQNTPGISQAADIGIFGVTKMLSGSTAIAAGNDLMTSSTYVGGVMPYSSAAGANRLGRALEAATAVGQVFTAALYGFGQGNGSIA